MKIKELIEQLSHYNLDAEIEMMHVFNVENLKMPCIKNDLYVMASFETADFNIQNVNKIILTTVKDLELLNND